MQGVSGAENMGEEGIMNQRKRLVYGHRRNNPHQDLG